MEGAVGAHRAEHLADWCDAALTRRFRGFDDQGRGAHADQHAVTAPVERQSRLLDDRVGGRGTGSKEARGHPFEHDVRGDVVGSDDHHAAAAPGANPVLGHPHGLGCAGAGRVDLRVGPACADQLGKLRMAHRQRPEEETPIEHVRFTLDGGCEWMDAVIDLGEGVRARRFRHPRAQRFELLQLLTAGTVALVVGDHADQGIAAGKRRRENDAGVVTHRFGQLVPFGQSRSQTGGAVAHHQRNPGVTQGIDPSGDGEDGGAVEGRNPLSADAVLFDEVDRAAPAGELDHLGGVVDDLEGGRAVLALDEPGDVLVEDGFTKVDGDDVDELFAVEDASHVGVVEDVIARQSQRSAGDAHGRRRSRCAVRACVGSLGLALEPVVIVRERAWIGHGWCCLRGIGGGVGG